MKKYTLLAVLFFGSLTQRSNAQCTVADNLNVGSRWLGYSATSILDLNFTANGNNAPYQMILTNGGDLNVTGGANGYMIGNNQMLYTGGDPTSIFAGEQIALINTYTIANQYNTCIGYKAGPIINSSSSYYGTYNTFSGAYAGNKIENGYSDTYMGGQAGGSDVNGIYNTFIGYKAGFTTQGVDSYTPPYGAYGDYNTFTGYLCGYSNYTGHTNNFYGKAAGYYNTGSTSGNGSGNENCLYGSHSGAGIVSYSADSNCFFGNYSGYAIGTGDDGNIFMGNASGYSSGFNYQTNYNVFIGGTSELSGYGTNNPGGNYNITLGFGADAFTLTGAPPTPMPIYNAAAIGAEAVVNNNNQMILGNNSQFVGIGMSYNQIGPMANLEIKTDSNPSTPPLGVGFEGYIGSGNWNVTNYYNGLGFTGLKFRDLTSYSATVDPGNTNFLNAEHVTTFPKGVLSVDQWGNVIYIPIPVGALGTCVVPTVADATDGGAINMNNQNFNFFGNTHGSTVNNVGIGLYTCTPNAKLEVLQNSGSKNTIAEYIENDDASNGVAGSPSQLIGIEGYIPAPIANTFYNVSGWFEADDFPGSVFSAPQKQYAIFVPSGGGAVDIGYAFSGHSPSWLLDVNGAINTPTVTYPSDSMLKKDVAPFKYGLKAIRNLNPVSYKYNGIGGFDSTHTYIGLIAQNLKRNVPGAVISSHIIKDTISRDTTTILNINENAVVYTAINAIKQLDSIVTSITHKDSIIQAKQQQTNDSLRSYITCLSQLCNNGHGAIHHHGGNGNSEDSSTTITNVQDVTLSAMSETPLLYQNTPNPFSTGTKINYYLPVNIQAAIIVFYDTYGNKMKSVQLTQTGNGTLNITPDNLTSGIYSYSLVVSGNVIDTKRMILQK